MHREEDRKLTNYKQFFRHFEYPVSAADDSFQKHAHMKRNYRNNN